MAVTTLISGGYRASAEVSIDMTAGGTQQVVVSSVVMNSGASTNFGFDINALATTWYMTAAQATEAALTTAVYYKLQSGDMSVSNPAANSTTTFNITDDVAGTETTLLDDYALEQGYFTSQVATPICKYMVVWQGMLVMAGQSTNPSRVWMSELNAPNIWSTFGGIQGRYDETNVNDGETVIGLAVQDGYLYVFKQTSVFIFQFTGNATAPVTVRQISEDIGSLSHWSAKSISGFGIIFMSQRGPARVSGTVVGLLPASKNITDRFEPNNSSRYNLAAMAYMTAGHNATKSQIHWGVSSTSATTRDLTLVYDYVNGAFWENDVSANYYNEVTDSNFFPSVWAGNYSSQIFQTDTGTNDLGSIINFSFETPNIQGKQAFVLNRWEQIHIAGDVQAAASVLNVSVYLDFSATASRTMTFDMSNAKFKSGLAVNLGLNSKAIRLKISNSQLDVPVKVDSIGLSFEPLREAYGAA